MQGNKKELIIKPQFFITSCITILKLIIFKFKRVGNGRKFPNMGNTMWQ